MRKILLFIPLFIALLLSSSCSKELVTPYDHPFFYLHVNNASELNIQSSRNETVDYPVYFSSRQQYETVVLRYRIVAGAGLTEGRDYELLSPTQELIYIPGAVAMPIRIKWINHPVDATQDNSLTIELIANDQDFTIGMPGPSKKMAALKITKI